MTEQRASDARSIKLRQTETLTVAICTYNRADNLPGVIRQLRALSCDIPVEILVVNNNSNDGTEQVLRQLAAESGMPLRYVLETQQGIPFARNRAIEESLGSTYLVFIDDDESPGETFLQSAYEELKSGADVVGGKIEIRFEGERPGWLGNDLLPFLGRVDHCDNPMDVNSNATPLWSGNIGYRMSLFRSRPEFRFDSRYNRAGSGVGGGSDGIMFRQFLEMPELKLRYNPKMEIQHHVDPWKLTRSYFLKLQYTAGYKKGRFQPHSDARLFLRSPRYLYRRFISQFAHTLAHYLVGNKSALRQAMSAAHTLGMIRGYRMRQAED